METLLAAVVTPETLKLTLAFMLAILARDVVVGMLRRLSKRLLTDKDKNNDPLGHLLDGAADGIEKFQLPIKPAGRK